MEEGSFENVPGFRYRVGAYFGNESPGDMTRCVAERSEEDGSDSLAYVMVVCDLMACWRANKGSVFEVMVGPFNV